MEDVNEYILIVVVFLLSLKRFNSLLFKMFFNYMDRKQGSERLNDD